MDIKTCLIVTLFTFGVILCPLAGADPDVQTSPSPSWLPPVLDTDSALFFWEGPLQINAVYSDELGFAINSTYGVAFGDRNALGGELTVGHRQLRVGGTWAFAVMHDQFLKVTGEFLRQEHDIKFAAGKHDDWYSQTAAGVAYQFIILHHHWLKNIFAKAYYARADSDTLDSVSVSGGTNLRHVAGAKTAGGAVGINLLPLPITQIGVALNYDQVNYNARFEKTPDRRGLGVTVHGTQLLGHYIKLTASGAFLAPYDLYKAGLFALYPTRPGTRLQFGVFVSRVVGDIPSGHDNRIGLNLAITWGGSPHGPLPHYHLENSQSQRENLLNWVNQPVVRMPQVLIRRDQTVVGP